MYLEHFNDLKYDLTACLGDLLDRPWIERVWTFQEIILASDPIIFCGDKLLLWADLIRGIGWMMVTAQDDKEFHQLGWWSPTVDNVTVDWFTGDDWRRISTHLESWLTIFNLWMDIERPTHWNGQKRRLVLPCGRLPLFPPLPQTNSLHNYQNWYQIRIFYLSAISHFAFGVIFTSVAALLLVLDIRSLGEPSPVVSPKRIAGIAIGAVLACLGVPLLVSPIVFVLVSRPCVTKALNKRRFGTHQSHKIEAILRTIRTRKMKNPRDKSYAMYGVLRRLDIELEKPDYSRPLGDIYKELFIKLISWEHGLNLLLDSGLHGLADAPSWVPDWSIDTDRTWLDSRYLYPRAGQTATCGSPAAWKLLHNSTVLRISGSWQGSTVFRSQQLRKIPGMSFDLYDNQCRQAHLDNIQSMLEFLDALLGLVPAHFSESAIPQILYEITHGSSSFQVEVVRKKSFDYWCQFLLRYLWLRLMNSVLE